MRECAPPPPESPLSLARVALPLALALACRATPDDAGPVGDAPGERADTGVPDAPVGPDTARPADTARPGNPDDSGDLADTGPPDGPCALPPDPGRGMGFQDLLERLAAQRCLVEEDVLAVEAWMEVFAANGLACDAVMRSWSADGFDRWSEPELVRRHASVPDVFVRDDGAHVLAYNDVTPGLLVDTIRADPARLWRQGLVGLGGLGVAIDAGDGFEAVEGLDLHLQALQQVVDPDVAELAEGTWRLAYFGIEPRDLEDGVWDPLSAGLPHRFWRRTGADGLDFPEGRVAVESSWGGHGGVDPTLLGLADGSEVLFLGGPDTTMPGWISPDGLSWDLGDGPDVVTGLGATTPDAMPDPRGGYRVYYRDNATGTYHVSTSRDGRAWSPGADAHMPTLGAGLSVAVDPDGVWWMYFNLRDPDCEARFARPGGTG